MCEAYDSKVMKLAVLFYLVIINSYSLTLLVLGIQNHNVLESGWLNMAKELIWNFVSGLILESELFSFINHSSDSSLSMHTTFNEFLKSYRTQKSEVKYSKIKSYSLRIKESKWEGCKNLKTALLCLSCTEKV